MDILQWYDVAQYKIYLLDLNIFFNFYKNKYHS